MVKLEIEFFSLVEDITNVKNKGIILQKNDPNVMDLFDILFNEFGSKFERAFFDRSSSNLKPGILVAVNGKNAYLLQGMETSLKEGDKIVIGYAFRGG